jgi:hypothetical protein
MSVLGDLVLVMLIANVLGFVVLMLTGGPE